MTDSQTGPTAGSWLAERYPDHSGAARLYGAELAGDTATLCRELRRRHGRVAPVLLDGGIPAWLVLGYREVYLVTSNPGMFGHDSRRWNVWDQIPPDWPLMSYVAWSPSIARAEGADHQRRAGVVGDALDAIERTELAAISERVADQLIDGFGGDGEADLMAQYALQIPMLAGARLAGLPEADAAAVLRDVAESNDADAGAAEAYTRLYLRIAELVKDKRDHPGADVASRMLAHPAGLTDDEAAIDLLMVVAAAKPIGDWVGNTLRLMLIDDQFSLALQGGRSSAAQALNEVLWNDPPMPISGRWATQDCELGGRRIRRGDLVLLGLAAANADPQVHPGSAGDSVTNRAHLAFGHGEYGCPFPAPELAEIVARTAVEVLLDRIPDVELAVPPGSLQWRPSAWMRALSALPVRFSPVAGLGGAYQQVLAQPPG